MDNDPWTLDGVTRFIRQQTGDRVCDGPFAGMKISFDDIPWQQWDKPSKMLGTYEQETHEFIINKSGPEYDCVIDIGCSEGFLAVGLALLNQNAKIIAYDTNEVAKKICAVNAEMNNVGDRILFGDFCDTSELIKQVQNHKKPFVLCDCEGYEANLFPSIETCWALCKADIIIECHEAAVPGVTHSLEQKFSISHNVTAVTTGARNPNKQPFINQLSDLDRWRAVCEFRTPAMTWLLCEAKCSTLISGL